MTMHVTTTRNAQTPTEPAERRRRRNRRLGCAVYGGERTASTNDIGGVADWLARVHPAQPTRSLTSCAPRVHISDYGLESAVSRRGWSLVPHVTYAFADWSLSSTIDNFSRGWCVTSATFSLAALLTSIGCA
uniref:Uncharacterized protein n=1 Tax=Plectus sambesii TaxID=2011161 RepID=A0A914WDX1_9BILA